MPERRFSVGEVAGLAGVSVRALHHYEHVGLLAPVERSRAGYRQYSDADLERLTRILYYRELDFSLGDIAALLSDANDIADHLTRQRALIAERLTRLQAMLTSLDKELEAQMSGHELTTEEKLEIFGDHYDPSWEDEAADRWGHTTAWQQSQQRAQSFTQADWRRIKAEGDEWNEAVVIAFQSGTPADSDRAAELAEAHRSMVAQHYDCSYAMHRQLADLYLADPRMTENYEQLAPGLAQWVHDAIHANADRHPGEQGDGLA